MSALLNDSYGRVLGCTFSLLLKSCTVAADVELSGSLFHCGMVFATKLGGFASWNDELVTCCKTTCSARVPDDTQLIGWYSYLLVQDLVQESKSRDPSSFFKRLQSQVCHHLGNTGFLPEVILDPSGCLPLGSLKQLRVVFLVRVPDGGRILQARSNRWDVRKSL